MTWLSRFNSLLSSSDIALRRIAQYPHRQEHGMRLLASHGFEPQTVVDVGVASGTPWLYSAFPGARLVLIEPNPACAEDVERIARERDADVYPVAVGTAEGELPLRVDCMVPSSSSLLPLSDALVASRAAKGDSRAFTEIPVPVLRLDDVMQGYQAPYLLKIDTEGYELEVLRGAPRKLEDTAVVITETNVAERFRGSYSFAELVSFLDTAGFRLFDFLDVRTLGRDGPLNYVDAVFVRS